MRSPECFPGIRWHPDSGPGVQDDNLVKKIGDAIAAIYLPSIHGILDDHIESWFLDYDQLPEKAPEGMESVINLGLSEEWLPPPDAPVPPK